MAKIWIENESCIFSCGVEASSSVFGELAPHPPDESEKSEGVHSVVSNSLWPQAPLSLEFSRQESWNSGVPFSRGSSQPRHQTLGSFQADSLPSEPPGKPKVKVKVLVAHSCPTLCNPMGCSPPGSPVHGVLQARILEWVAIPFSRGSPQPRDQTWVFCIVGRYFTVWATREALHVRVPGSKAVLPGQHPATARGHPEYLLAAHWCQFTSSLWVQMLKL